MKSVTKLGTKQVHFKFSEVSKIKLAGVHPNLTTIANLALELSPIDFAITDGLRTKEQQQKLFDDKKSKTLNSRHLTGHAIDVAAFIDGKLTWDWAAYETIAVAFKRAACMLGVSITWGGDWLSFRDGPHFELSWKEYPLEATEVKATTAASTIDDDTRARAAAWVAEQNKEPV